MSKYELGHFYRKIQPYHTLSLDLSKLPTLNNGRNADTHSTSEYSTSNRDIESRSLAPSSILLVNPNLDNGTDSGNIGNGGLVQTRETQDIPSDNIDGKYRRN